MMTQILYCRFVRIIAVASLLSCAASEAFTQGAGNETKATGNGGPHVTASSTSYDIEVHGAELTWNGAKRKEDLSSVHAYLFWIVELLRDQHPEANFVLSPGLEDIVIDDLKLRASSVEEKLEALRIASGSQFAWRLVRPPLAIVDPATGLSSTPDRRPAKAMFALDSLPVTTQPSLQLEAFHLGEHFRYMYGSNPLATNTDARQKLIAEQIKTIELMMHQTLDEYRSFSHRSNSSKGRSTQAPSIRFHPGANLIVIMGESEAVSIAAKVIAALPGVHHDRCDTKADGDPFHNVDEVIKRHQLEGAPTAPRR